MLEDFLTPYLQSSYNANLYHYQYNKMMMSVFVAYGFAIGMLCAVVIMAILGYHIPLVFAILQSVSWITGVVIFILAHKFSKNVLIPSEQKRLDHMFALRELEFVPVKKND